MRYLPFVLYAIFGAALSVSAATILFPSGGGTGTNVPPTLGQILVGNASGVYMLPTSLIWDNAATSLNVPNLNSFQGGNLVLGNNGGDGGNWPASITIDLNGGITLSPSGAGGPSPLLFENIPQLSGGEPLKLLNGDQVIRGPIALTDDTQVGGVLPTNFGGTNNGDGTYVTNGLFYYDAPDDKFVTDAGLTYGSSILTTPAITLSALTGTQCLHEISGVVSGTGSDCGSGGGSSGTVGTSTALVSGQVNFSTGVNTIGNDSTFLFDTTNKRLTATNASTTAFSALGTAYFGSTGQSFINAAGQMTLGGALTYGGVTLNNAVVGTASMVLSTSPTLITPVFAAPRGGTAVTSTMTISGTTGANPTTANVAIRGASTNSLVTTFTRAGVGIGTTTPLWNLEISSSTAPQLALDDGGLTVPWMFRSTSGSLFIATSSLTTFATSSESALSIDPNGVVSVKKLSIGALSGFLKATAGVVATALINLASDVTGILPIANGGTGTSTAPTYGAVYMGDAAGKLEYVATSTLGLLGNLFTFQASTTASIPSTAVARLIANKLSDTISVKDFGAKGDGATDDTASIQAAFNYASTTLNARGTVYFPAGTYNVSATLLANSSVLLDHGATVHATAAMVDLLDLGNGVTPLKFSNGDPGAPNPLLYKLTVEGGILDGNDLTTGAVFHSYNTIETSVINNVKVYNAPLYAFQIEAAGSQMSQLDVERSLGTVTPAGSIGIYNHSSDNHYTDINVGYGETSIWDSGAGAYWENVHVYDHNLGLQVGIKESVAQASWHNIEVDKANAYGVYDTGDIDSWQGLKCNLKAPIPSSTTVCMYFVSSPFAKRTHTVNNVTVNGDPAATFKQDIVATSTTLLYLSQLVDVNVDTQTQVGDFTFATGTAAFPQYSFGTATTSGIYLTSTSTPGLGFTLGGVNVLTLLSATSTFASGLTVPSLSIGSLSGILKAVGGYVTTALVNLAADVTGILPIANGGTNASSQTTNGVNYFDGTSITSGTGLTFDGTNAGIGSTTPSALLAINGANNKDLFHIATSGNPNILDLDNTGQFTITSTFAGPTFQLRQADPSTVDGNSTLIAQYVNTDLTNGDYVRFGFRSFRDNTVPVEQAVGKFGVQITSHASTTGQTADMVFTTRVLGTLAERMRIQGNNLGIGSSTPDAQLSLDVASSTAGTSTTRPIGVGIRFLINAVQYVIFSFDLYGRTILGGPAPVISACGTSPSFIGAANDQAMTIQVGSVAATGCTATFAHAWAAAPTCHVTERTGSVANVFSYTVSTTAVVVTQTGLTSDILDITCVGTK